MAQLGMAPVNARVDCVGSFFHVPLVPPAAILLFNAYPCHAVRATWGPPSGPCMLYVLRFMSRALLFCCAVHVLHSKYLSSDNRVSEAPLESPLPKSSSRRLDDCRR